MATVMNKTEESVDLEKSNDFIEIQCNWEIKTDKKLRDIVSTMCASEAPESLGVDNIVSLESCVALFSNNADTDSCLINIKLTNNKKIKRIAVVSEATILEFFKQSGEYSGTQFAEFVDEFEDQSVYIGEFTMDNPTSEAGIKFTKTKRKHPEMWLYGITLVLTKAQEEKSSGMLNFDIINGYLTNSKLMNTDKTTAARRLLNSFSFSDMNVPNFEATVGNMFKCESESSRQEKNLADENVGNKNEYKNYIDSKFDEVEKRLTKKIEDLEMRINTKLDTILAILNK